MNKGNFKMTPFFSAVKNKKNGKLITFWPIEKMSWTVFSLQFLPVASSFFQIRSGYPRLGKQIRHENY